jgi:type II secretory ATPase GspE/PulE/Tfp pilus assembly ATPase PilB-like protein
MNSFVSQLDAARLEEQAQRKAEQLKIGYVDLRTISVNLEALKIIPEPKARQIQAAVFDAKPHEFSLAAVFPDSQETTQLVKEIKKFGNVSLFVASQISFDAFLDNYQFVPKTKPAISGIMTVAEKYITTIGETKNPTEFFNKLFSSEADITEIITWILAYGVAYSASDLHLEPTETSTNLRYRLDGVLYPTAAIPPSLSYKINDRLKLVSKINLNVRNIPQDGRFSIKLEKYDMEMRVSTIPGPNGENIVMRYLNPKTIGIQLESLGFREQDLAILAQEIKKPNGLILVTGPTGSGKTTTLYSCLKKVSSSENKVITIEDPIEYKLPGIEQTQTNANSDYTFASGLRAILRQDPDVILVGEIRDQETAEIAMQASLTGHLVFSTLHTNNAAGAIPRLLDFKIKPEIISAALNLIIAQRLVRKLCPRCAKTTIIDQNTRHRMNLVLSKEASRLPNLQELMSTREMKQPAGCPACNKGYKGRVGVFELIQVTDALQSIIRQTPDEIAIKNYALGTGSLTLLADALIKVLAGITDLEETERVVGPLPENS